MKVIFSTLLLICLITISCTNAESEKQTHLERGKKYLLQKQYAEARIEYRSALKIDKKSAEAHFGLGEAALALGYVQEAAEAYYEAMRIDPENLEARVKVGGLLAQYPNDESLKEAERLATDVLNRKPDYIEGHLLMANVRIAKKEWDAARQDLQRAIDLDPNRVETQLNLARYFDRRGSADHAQSQTLKLQADTVYQQLIKKNPGTADIRLAYGDFLFANERVNDAEQQLLEALKSDPNDKLILVALRRFYETQERFADAEKYLTRLVELDSDKTSGRAQIIDLHARTGKTDQAIVEYQQLIKDDPKYLRAYSRLAELLLESGDEKGATAFVNEALKRNPQDTDALLMRGRLHTLNGLYREAIDDLDHARRFEPTLPAALYYSADAHLQNHDTTQARLFVNQLLSYYPRNPMGLQMLARIQLNESKPLDADKTATQIIESIDQLRSNDTALKAARIPAETLPEWEGKAYVSRAVARIQLQNFPAAQSDLENAVKIDRRSPEPYINLAAVALLRGDLAGAQRAAERAVEMAPNNLSAVTTLTNVYLRQRNYQAAHAKIDEMLRAQPNRVQLLDQKARIFVAQKDTVNAEKMLRRTLEIDPNYLNAYFALSDLYQSSQQQTDRAISELREMIKASPNKLQQVAQAHLFIGMLEEGRGNFDESIRNYEQALGFDKRSMSAAIAFNNLAWLYADKEKGNLDKATDYARSAISITPQASFYDTLGYAYYKKRQYEVAVEQFNKAIDRRPYSPGYHLHKARALRDNGDTQKARYSYERAIQVGGPNYVESGQARQELAALKRS